MEAVALGHQKMEAWADAQDRSQMVALALMAAASRQQVARQAW